MSILFYNNIAMEPLKVPKLSKETMIKQSLNELPHECCGLLLGKNGKIKRTIPMRNTEPSPEAYFMDPSQQVEVFTDMEEKGEKLVGIYHSHPKGPSTPSGADLKMAFHQDAVYIIISLENRNKPVLSAFFLKKGAFKEVKLI